MLKRQKTEQKPADQDEPPSGSILIAATDPDARATYAAVLATRGFEAAECELADAGTVTSGTKYGCTVVVGTGADENTAITQISHMRNSEHQQVRRTAVLLLVPSARNQIYAWESGIDGFLVLPAHVDDLVADVRAILARPRLERFNHRQAMLERSRR
ncbi:MAG: response regulator transcription factor [Acidimicrobiia bacterium]|nr:response regulator transcription factor [Acidimicrobiia bacterium]